MADSKIERGLELLRSGRCETIAEAARNTGCVRKRLSEAWAKERPENLQSFDVDPSREPSAPWKPKELLEAHGLDPEEWVVARIRGNRWGPPEEPMHQLRVDVVPKPIVLELPDPSKWKAPKLRKRKVGEPRKHVVIGDHHCPHHDKTFHKLFLEYLRDEQPDELDVNGDTFDFSTISRHRPREGYSQSVNECLTAGYEVLKDFRWALPNAQIRLKLGNHCQRLVNAILDNMRDMHGVAPAGEEIPALDLRRLVHLDELKIEYVEGEWDRVRTRPSRKLSVLHGYSTSKNAAEQMLTKLSGSSVQNHTHRLSLHFRTEHTDDPEEPTTTRMAAEAGCACEIKEGLGYVRGAEADWQNGCLLNYIYDDGDFLTQPGVYVPGRFLAPNGRRYDA